MANIVNAGIIVLLAAFGLVAVMGAADELRPEANAASGSSGPEEASAAEADEPGLLDVDKPALGKALDDDRSHKRGHGDRDDDRKHGDKGDGKDDEDDDREDDDDDDEDDR